MLGVDYHTVTEDALGLQTVLDANRQDLQHGAIGELIYKFLVILMFPNERKGVRYFRRFFLTGILESAAIKATGVVIIDT